MPLLSCCPAHLFQGTWLSLRTQRIANRQLGAVEASFPPLPRLPFSRYATPCSHTRKPLIACCLPPTSKSVVPRRVNGDWGQVLRLGCNSRGLCKSRNFTGWREGPGSDAGGTHIASRNAAGSRRGDSLTWHPFTISISSPTTKSMTQSRNMLSVFVIQSQGASVGRPPVLFNIGSFRHLMALSLQMGESCRLEVLTPEKDDPKPKGS
ncbi:hypothetical protein LX36DRAFT_138598 [Colletotrichum falcatum]|nr:hypothetical protein LX36DRAFT_138598 [Colletotrichum falcatum]